MTFGFFVLVTWAVFAFLLALAAADYDRNNFLLNIVGIGFIAVCLAVIAIV